MSGRLVVSLFVTSFALNAVWEMGHMPAYAEMAGRPWRATLLGCGRASLVDAALTLAIWALALRIVRSRAGLELRLAVVMALTGALVAVLLETAALELRWWSYTSRMPRLPLVGAGLWPVLQLAILPPLSLLLASLVRPSSWPSRAGA